MPSPTLTTVPTLVNDAVSSKPSICCRMMSLISVGRTAMVCSSYEREITPRLVTAS
jgi:hypothetical protein